MSAWDQALAAARGIASADPLSAEVLASAVLSISRRELADEDVDREWADQLVRRLARVRTADALAFLTTIHALLAPEWRELAAGAMASLRRQGVAPPPWAADIETPRVLEGWSATDEYGDQTVVGIGFRHGAWVPSGLQFMVDRNFDGLVRQASTSPRPDLMQKVWSELAPSDLVPHPASTQEVADRLAQGLRMYDLYMDPPVYDDVRRLVPLLRARVRLLPPAHEPPEEKELSASKRRRLARAFAASTEAPAGLDAELLASYFIDYGADYTGGDPLRWSPVRVELCMMDWFPRKVALDRADAASVPTALRGWVRFAARQKEISTEGLAETLAAVDEFGPQFLDAMSDESRFGPAKSLVRAMVADGVDPTANDAVQQWIGAHNARLLAGIAAKAGPRQGGRRSKP